MCPYLSIIIPTFNRMRQLARTLDAFAEQGFGDFEIVVVDDGSTDATLEMLRRYNIRLIEQRNAGASHAQGEIVVYCDSDDRFYPHALETVAALYENDPAASFALCNHRRTITLIDDTGQRLASLDDTRADQPASLEDFYNWQIKTTSSGLSHRRQIFAGKAEWKTGFMIEDLEFLMQLAVLDAGGFRYLSEPLLDYEQVYGGNGLCSGASYADYAHAFGMIHALHENDPLMKNPSVYLGRVEKYRLLQEQASRGEIAPPQLKYFPHFWNRP